MLKTARLCILAVCLGLTGYTLATIDQAFGAPPPNDMLIAQAAPAAPGAGSGSATTPTPVPLPSDSLHNPATDPVAAWDDAKSARKLGWPSLVFAVVTMLAWGLGTVGKNLTWLAWLNKGKTATILGAAAAIGMAGYNAAVEGGTIYAMGFAVLMALGAFWKAHKEPASA